MRMSSSSKDGMIPSNAKRGITWLVCVCVHTSPEIAGKGPSHGRIGGLGRVWLSGRVHRRHRRRRRRLERLWLWLCRKRLWRVSVGHVVRSQVRWSVHGGVAAFRRGGPKGKGRWRATGQSNRNGLARAGFNTNFHRFLVTWPASVKQAKEKSRKRARLAWRL